MRVLQRLGYSQHQGTGRVKYVALGGRQGVVGGKDGRKGESEGVVGINGYYCVVGACCAGYFTLSSALIFFLPDSLS